MTTLESLGVDVIGLNCSTGPEHMREPIRYLAEHASLPLSVIPNAGLPLNTGVGEAIYPLEPAPMAAVLARVRGGVRRADRRRLLRHDAGAPRGSRQRGSAVEAKRGTVGPRAEVGANGNATAP